MTEKLIPQAMYPCSFCSDERYYPATELFWSDIFKAWFCEECWGNRDEHCITTEKPKGVSFLTYEYGISLQTEIDRLDDEKKQELLVKKLLVENLDLIQEIEQIKDSNITSSDIIGAIEKTRLEGNLTVETALSLAWHLGVILEN